jgi:hypothetical protein
VTGSGCGTLQSSNAADAVFTSVPKSATTCTATVSLHATCPARLCHAPSRACG